MNRQDRIDAIRHDPSFPVLIIGAGVNGIGTFRELALQGLDVLMVDRGDFCGGASAASSHMIHGGIRYLENGEFRLVREAVRERNRLLVNAPHLTRPLPTNIPIFKRFSGLLNAPLKFLGVLDKPGERGALVIKMGLQMYDAYTGEQETVPRHTFVGRKEALARYPALNPDVRYLATYYDGVMPSPERICIDMLLDAEAAHERALALNYMTAVSAEDDTVTLRDELSGELITVRPEVVVNAAGPWIDLTNNGLGGPTRFIGGTKGSHIVLDHPELLAALDGHEFFFENSDGRIVLVLPIFGRVVIGTTDLHIDDPDEAVCTDEEVDYFIDLTRTLFPDLHVSPDQIVFRFSGVRPLPASEANTTGQISRDHLNRVIESEQSGRDYPIMNLIGGKWTTYRAFSQQVSDDILFRLGERRLVQTENLAIGGGRDYPADAAERQAFVVQVAADAGLSQAVAEDLFQRYGTRAATLAPAVAAGGDRPLLQAPGYTVGEVTAVVLAEQVQHIDDLLLRRTLLAMRGEVTGALVQEIGAIMAPVLGWSVVQLADEKMRVVTLFREKYQVVLEEEERVGK